ncbi:MAG: NADPH-dependent assimilatory sulfite reductase hemoprotein subunit [Planctomycetota bacterium]|nr:MAG: NADPH-dependent assimilatory sulfite reductase hemoprotein subunit [Planctomycetota bacterium]
MSTKRSQPLVEHVKATSSGLRGRLRDELKRGRVPFTPSSALLLKHHGVFQQADRDRRAAADNESNSGFTEYMVRLKAPAGKLTAEHWLAVFDLADRYGAATVQLTSRQGVQIPGVPKDRLARLLQGIAAIGLTSIGSGGDLNCNVMCCPPPALAPQIVGELDSLAAAISDSLRPDSAGYRETWRLPSRDEPADSSVAGAETSFPYGAAFLPHKFKIAVATADDNCADAFAQDVGLVADIDGACVKGYTVLVGGGLGHIPSGPRSFPRLATPLAYVSPGEVLPLIHAIVRLYRDHGDRSCRSRGRLKYLVHDWGIARIREHLEADLGWYLALPREMTPGTCLDHSEWTLGGDGRWAVGLHVVDGLVADTSELRLKTALRTLFSSCPVTLRISPRRRLLLGGVADVDRRAVESILDAHGVKSLSQVTPIRRWSDACSGLPMCGRAITESHRLAPGLLDCLEHVLDELGLGDEPLCVRVAACSAGCTRSYMAEIAIVGRTICTDSYEGKYAIYVGGDRCGTRLAALYHDLVPSSRIIAALTPLLRLYRQDRLPDETFGAYCARVGVGALRYAAARFEE